MVTTFWKYKVRGHGLLPLDMLRYDRACPDTQEDVQLLDMKYERTINLICFLSAPEAERWSSFGWRIFDISKRKV